MEFAKAGADLAIADLDFAGAQNTCALIEELGRKVLPIHLDVTDPEACEKAVQEVVDTFGKLDVLVNNAGISQKSRSPT